MDKNISDYFNNNHINQNNGHNGYDLSKPKEIIKEDNKFLNNQNIEDLLNDLKNDLINDWINSKHYEHIYKIDNIIKLIK